MENFASTFLSMDEIVQHKERILASPKESGTVEMICVRPAVDEREQMQTVTIDMEVGVVGDNWKRKGSSATPDGSANPEAQITLMNSRVIDILAQDRSRWELAGDQFFVDFDLSQENLPAGQRVALGTAVLEVSAVPHQGCAKFVARYGKDAHKFVNNAFGSQNRFRGVNMKVVQAGTVQLGDTVHKI